MTAVEPVLEVHELSRSFGTIEAVQQVSFAVAPGEFFGLLGPNGAGKTTTIKILSTLLEPSSGTARIGGLDVRQDPEGVRRQIGLLFQDPSLDDRLTARENLRFHAALYGIPASVAEERIAVLLTVMDLASRADTPPRTFSGGMRRRLEAARALLHVPRILILDEPTTGLDPQSRRAFWDLIRLIRQERQVSVLLTTHYMEEAEVCDRIAIMDHGQLIALDSPEVLKSRLGGETIVLGLESDGHIPQFAWPAEAVGEDRWRLQVASAESALPDLVQAFGPRIRSLDIQRPSLDDVFIALTGRALRDAEGDQRDRMREMLRLRGGRRR